MTVLPEPAVEQRAHEAKHVREERNNLRNDEGEYPCRGDDRRPCRPTDDGVRMPMPRVLEKTEEHKAGGYRLILAFSGVSKTTQQSTSAYVRCRETQERRS